jgi:hypothetical protein
MAENTTITHTVLPVTLIQQALDKGVDMVQLQALMDLQERWEKKEARKAFFEALSLFQKKCPELKKNKRANITSKNGGPSFSYTYADLGSIAAQIKDALNECGLAYRWEFQESNNKIKCTCFVSHSDGHTETTSMEAGKDNSGSKNEIQQQGSTQTYLQRYTLIGALGLSTADQDNDGKQATPKNNYKNQQQPQPQQQTGANDEEEELIAQWQVAVDECRTKIELTTLYMKNKKAVDANDRVKVIFKRREEFLKGIAQPSSPVNNMP